MTYNDDINKRRPSDYYEEASTPRRPITQPLNQPQYQSSSFNRSQPQSGPSFNITGQVSAHPWAAVGLALAAGFVLGNSSQDQPTTQYTPRSYGSSGSIDDGFWSDVRVQFDNQIDVLKTAAIATAISSLRDVLGEISPAAQQALGQTGLFGGSTNRNPTYSGNAPTGNTSYGNNTSTGNTSYNSATSGGGASYTSGNVHASGASYTAGSGSGSSAPTTSGTMSDSQANSRVNNPYATGISNTGSDARSGGHEASSAPNTSMDTGAGTVGFDSPPVTSSQLSNPEARGTEHEDPYYPPGGPSDSITGDKNRK